MYNRTIFFLDMKEFYIIIIVIIIIMYFIL